MRRQCDGGKGRRMKSTKKIALLVFSLILALVLAACSQSSEGSTSASASASGASASASSDGASASSAATNELVGSPWVTSVLSGNLPAEQPEAKDDLYTHYNYAYLAAHQGEDVSMMGDYASDLQAAITAIVKNESKAGHDLDQLRIFYNQAADTEALKAAGFSEIKPYLDRIEAVASLDEMNALLTAEDFPFSPFIMATLSLCDTRSTNMAAINPNFVLCDALLVGGMLYQDSDDPQVQKNQQGLLIAAASYPAVDFIDTGMSQDEALELMDSLIEFEKAHGKYLEAPNTYLKSDYGAMAESVRASYFTLDELCAFAPNFPLKATLDKLGKGGSETYIITKEWLEAFNGLWTEENLDAIKLVAKANVLVETRPYRDPSTMNAIMAEAGMAVPDADSFAYTACTSLDTLGNVVAKTYVDDVLGPNAKTRLAALSQDLVNTYKSLVDNTTWLGEESKRLVVEKLDHMTLNVLEPVGGYFDYSGLELTPTNQGGTLFSNYLKLKQYRQDCESKLIGQPAVAATPWFGATPTMNNAFYDPLSNSINIMPGFVTSLFYTDDMSDADLLAGAGWTIGHEISHGFDYTGSQLDAYGTPNPVFSDADVDKFVLKCSTLASYYKGIEIMPGQMVDGEAVVGEAAADLCGEQACLELASKIDGFDYEKYFVDISNVWAEVMTEPMLQRQTLDVHPLSNLRVNVCSQMLDAMYSKLGVAEGDDMYLAPEERIVIWGPNS